MIKIGEQIWSDKNIDIIEYRNGDSIICANSPEEWESANKKEIGAYCNFMLPSDYIISCGRLYNHYAVIDSRNIAPEGWSVPYEEDFNQLFSFIRENFRLEYHYGLANYGYYLKASDGWDRNNGINSDKFNAVPSGFITTEYLFNGVKATARNSPTDFGGSVSFWTKDILENNLASAILLTNFAWKERRDFPKGWGCSIRLIKDI